MGCGGGEEEDEHWGSIDVPRAVQEAISMGGQQKKEGPREMWSGRATKNNYNRIFVI
jgi:hypothetical protein